MPDSIASPWIAPTLSGTWINYNDSATWTTAGYRKNPDGLVLLKGLVENGAAPASEIFVLDAGFRPTAEISPAVMCFDGTNYTIARIYIETNGGVNFQTTLTGAWSTTTGIVFLDGLAFYADQGRQ